MAFAEDTLLNVSSAPGSAQTVFATYSEAPRHRVPSTETARVETARIVAWRDGGCQKVSGRRMEVKPNASTDYPLSADLLTGSGAARVQTARR